MDRFTAMEAFIRVIETGSFSAAARQLHVGQPAVSKTIAQLEERLGVRLLSRSTRGLSPTEAGQNFYERAKRALEEAAEADLAARGAGAGLSGRLRVSMAVTFGRLYVIPALPAFLDQHPALDIDIVMDDASSDLIGEGIDVALRMGSLRDSTLTARKLGQCRRLVLATPAYFARAGIPATPAELSAHQAISLAQSNITTAWTFRHGTTETSVSVRGRVRLTAAEGVRAAVLAGLGLTIGSEWMFARELANGRVQEALTDWSLPPLELWAVYPAGRQASAKARAFAAHIEATLGGA